MAAMSRCSLVLVLGCVASLAHAEAVVPVVAPLPAAVPASARAQAVRRSGPIAIDGVLDEAVWAGAPRHGGFTQRFPKDGTPAAFATEFAIAYDDAAVYVAVWASDPEPAKIRGLLTRRDIDSPADEVAVCIDSYHDKRTAYLFQINAAGVQFDQLLFDDTQADATWDAVWTGEAKVTATGWVAEYRIPLNQLRFPSADVQQWGFQVMREVARTQEFTSWARWPRTSNETVSKFGELDGIRGLAARRRLELLPYATGGLEQGPVAAGDPLNDEVSAVGNLGVDLKYGLGSAFTLSATINPDFGQVEADPSQVNLSGNELFFDEKRPFFLEGIDLFKVRIGNSDNSIEGMFYSRRIGAAPTSQPDDYEFIDMPTSTSIYGAAKLTGKTRGGWSVGLFNAVTGSEEADLVRADGSRAAAQVAPLTNYAAARVLRDLRAGKTQLGLAATAVNRALDGSGLEDELHDQAYVAAATVQHRWWENAWTLNLSALGSVVTGSEDAIARTQLQQRHLFQRPDARAYHFDPTRTHLTGGGVRWKVGRMGDTKHWRYMFGGDVRSAGLELNDAGFQRSSDRAVPFLWAQYHDETPGDDVLNWQVQGDFFAVADELGSDPRVLEWGFEGNISGQLANYWNLNGGTNIVDARWAPNQMRGGATLHNDPYVYLFGNVATDTRKPVYFSLAANGSRQPRQDYMEGALELGATLQLRSNLDVYLGPRWSMRTDPFQYVEETTDQAGNSHVVMARIREQGAAMTVRVNWTLSPRLSLQAYAQPYIATGRYAQLKDMTAPGAAAYRDRFTSLEGGGLSLMDGTYTATSNGNTFSFRRPDFDFRELRSNVVMRWEYRPGSSVFAIWSHGRSSSGNDGRFALGRNLDALGDSDGENVFMVKANYWVGL